MRAKELIELLKEVDEDTEIVLRNEKKKDNTYSFYTSEEWREFRIIFSKDATPDEDSWI